MSMKEAYEKKLQAQLDEWSLEIEKLKAKADVASAEAQIEYYKQLDELRALRDKSHQKLVEIRDASDDAWEDIKIGADMAWDAMAEATKSAVARFK